MVDVPVVFKWLWHSSGWSSAASSPSSDTETERPNRRWRWKFATPCRSSLSLPSFFFCFFQQPAIYLINFKFFFYSSRFFDLFEKYGGYKTGKLKLKKPKQLQVTPSETSPSHFCQRVCDSLTACYSEQEVLDITRQLLAELGQHNDCEIEEKKSKLEQLKTVLEMWVPSKLGRLINSYLISFQGRFSRLTTMDCKGISDFYLVLNLCKEKYQLICAHRKHHLVAIYL